VEDYSVIRKFVAESNFSEEIKRALMECIGYEIQGKPLSDYSNLVKKIAEAKNEN
jgi:hypothetical protein